MSPVGEIVSRRPLIVEIELGTSLPNNGRWASLLIGGTTVFTELVYDVDAEGNRSIFQAQRNLLSQFANRLSIVLESK